jgi:ABC-2 type transport system permease protein
MLSFRQGEQMLVSLGIPLGVLLFFSRVEVVDVTEFERPLDFLAPGVLALAVMSSALVSLGIGTGFERYYGVLKRLGTTPLGRPRLIAAKAAMVLVVEVVQFALLIPVGLLLGFEPKGGWAAVALATVLGTAAFAGLALLMAGTLSGPLNLALCNGLYLVLLATGGMMVPFEKLPGPVQAIASGLPAAALADAMIGSLTEGQHVHAGSWAVLAAWAVILPALAAWRFRWDPERR